MGTIPFSKIKKVKKLYYDDLLPMVKVAQKLGASMDALVYFMRKYDLKRRSVSENEKIKFERKLPSFRVKTDLNLNEKELKALATALYWGEGYKSSKAHGVDFANSDTGMIKVFMNFLRKICRVDESRLRVYLYCYINQNPASLIKYWSKMTKIPISRFSKPYARKDFRLDKKEKMKNGLIHVRYYDKKLLLQVMSWIEEYRLRFVI